MQNEPLTLRPSRRQLRTYGTVAAVLCIVSIWLGVEVALGKPDQHGFWLVLFFAVFTLATTIKLYGEKLRYASGQLTLTRIFSTQRINLPSLVRAERYTTTGKYPNPMLRLEDGSGDRMVINPGDFTTSDLNKLIALISPYVFAPNVSRNFTDLQFYVEQYVTVPKSSLWHTVRGTFLYILLPCIVLTLLLIVWAIATKQPAFR